MEEVKPALEQLAFLHATTYHLIQSYPGGFEKFEKDKAVFCPKNLFGGGEDNTQAEDFEKFASMMFMNCINVVRECSSKELADRMEEFNKQRQKIIQAVTEPQGPFNLITHGDAWYSNMMFRLVFANFHHILREMSSSIVTL